MKILIKNCILISMDTSKEQIRNNIDILIEDDKIVKIDNFIQESDIDTIIDATNKVVLPGLINTHSHIPMSIFRETIDGLPLQDWLEYKIWPMEAKLTKEDIYYASMLSFIEMIKTGSTTVNDMYSDTEKIIEARDLTGIRLQTTRTLMSRNGEEESTKRIAEFKELIENYQHHDDTLSFNTAIHGLYTSDEFHVKEYINLARELNLPIHIHFCENNQEVKDIEAEYQRTPSQVLIDNFQDTHTILAHAVKLTDEELEQIKDLNIHISSCPISNLKLGCGIPKIAKMLSLGINVSLGTDGQGSGSSLDMFEVMKTTALLQKGIHEDPTLIPAYEVLKMATINGAKALNLDNITGSIEVGKKADLIILNMDEVISKPTNDLISQIVYNMKGTNVETTIVSGKILMQDRVLKVDIEENFIKEKCEEIIKRINTN